MRVLMVTSRLPQGKQSFDMAPAVRQIESLRQAGIEVDLLQVNGWPKVKYLQAIPQLWRRAKNVDIIHAHYGFCGWLAKLRAGKPVVVSFMGDDLLGTPDEHGRLSSLSRRIVRSNKVLAKRVDGVIVKSAEMAGVVAPVKASVIANGVDLVVFAPRDIAAARNELGWQQDRRYVLFPGNPANPRKGFRFAERAVQQLRALLPDIPIELVALWNVDPIQVPAYMNASDVMLMASFIEGSPNVVKEALACNLPVVSVPVGDVELMLDGIGGCSVCPRDETLVASALADVLRGQNRCEGRTALIQRGLDLASVAQRVISVYEHVLGSRSARTASSLAAHSDYSVARQ